MILIIAGFRIFSSTLRNICSSVIAANSNSLSHFNKNCTKARHEAIPKKYSNFHHTRGIMLKRVTSHLQGLAPGQHSSVETS